MRDAFLVGMVESFERLENGSLRVWDRELVIYAGANGFKSAVYWQGECLSHCRTKALPTILIARFAERNPNAPIFIRADY